MSDRGLRGGLAVLRDSLRSDLWPLPIMGVVLALILGFWFPVLDGRIDDSLPPTLKNLLFGGGGGAASTVLDAIASSTVTVTSLTFSLTVVTLQLASSQFSPRLLRTFTSDLFVQVTLALFLSTFTFSLTVLRSVRSEGGSHQEFVPRLSVTVAFILATASVIGLVLFLAHLAQVIRVETMLQTVRGAAGVTLRRELTARAEAPWVSAVPTPPAHATLVHAPASGFLVGLDREDLVATAKELDAIIMIDRWPGTWLVEGNPIGAAWPRSGIFDRSAVERLRRGVTEAVQLGKERTSAEDIGYGLRQLTDVAVKALSPGINDPTTAVHALGHSASLLCEFAGRVLGADVITDEDNVVRLAVGRPAFADLLELAVAQPRRYGAADPDVLARVFGLLAEVGWQVELAEQRAAVTAQLGRLHSTAAAADFDDAERAMLSDLGESVERALRQDWVPSKEVS